MTEIILDPPEDFLDGRHLIPLVDRWLASLKVRPKTAVSYAGKIKYFTDWWSQEGPQRNWRLTQSALGKFEEYLSGFETDRFRMPLAYNTRKAIIRALRMMFRWACNTGRTSKNYGEWCPWPEGAPPSRRAANSMQLARLMVAALESRYPLRDQAILAFFIGTGCRLGEVASLTVENVQMLADGAGTALVVGKRTRHNRTGERSVAFDGVTGRYLTRYMDDAKIHKGYLWFTEDGERLSGPGIYQMVKRTVIRAELTTVIRGCHDLRRAFATILGLMHPDSPGWADLVRRQLGHKHYSQTAHYTLLDVDDIRERIVNPLGG